MPPDHGDKHGRDDRPHRPPSPPPRKPRSSSAFHDIPLGLTIAAFFVAPPLGILLLIARSFKSMTAGSSKRKKSKRSSSSSKTSNGTGLQFVPTALGGFFLLCAIVSLGSVLTSASRLLPSSFVTFGVLAAAAAVAFGVSGLYKKRSERCDKYLVIVGERPYFSIAALAAASGVSYRRAARDIQHMINRGMLGDTAFIDVGQKMLFMSPEAAAEYEASRPASPLEDEKQAEDRVPVDEYRRIILEIRRLNDEIADIAVSDRIYRLEESTSNIFDYVKEHPEKKASIRTLMNYYLPTTLKLLGSYADIERVGVAGENMKKSKESIEKTLDMLVYAFQTELDRLYGSEALDISGDIEVLEQMLRRDGITGTSTAAMTEEAHDEQTL